MLNRLAMMLLESGMVTRDEIDAIELEHGPSEIDLADQLIAAGVVPEDLVTEFLSDIYSVEPVFLNEIDIDKGMAQRFPEELARKFLMVPVREDGEFFYLAMGSPGDLYAIDEAKFSVGKEVMAYASAPSAVRRAQDDLYGKVDDLVSVEDQLIDYDEDLDEIEVVESLEGESDEDWFDSGLDDEYASGQFAIQCHNEGMIVEARNLYYRDLGQ